MNKNFLYISSLAVSSLLTLVACNDETGIVDGNNNGKTSIALSVGNIGNGPISKAITEMPDDATNLSTIPTGTSLFMVMKSQVGEETPEWTMTKAVTGEAVDNISPVNFSEAGTLRFWDDCGARDAAVSIYSVCTPGGTPNTPTIGGKSEYTYISTPTTGAWSTTANALTMSDWTVVVNQAALTAKTFADQDLCYSNNVAKYSDQDKRMRYDNEEAGKFDKGKLVFYHALTKVTVNITAGDGFDAAGGKKAFVGEPTAVLHDLKISSDFELTAGVVTPKGDAATDITTFKTGSKEVDNAQVVTRSAIVMPGRKLNASDNLLTVSADGNTYNVTAEYLVNEMPDEKEMLQGTEYIINVRFSKTGIKVTATVKAWDEIEAAEETPLINVTTAYGQANTETNDFGKGFSFLRSTTIDDGYTENAKVTCSGSPSVYTMSPQLYWPNHSTHYFFRGVWPLIGESGTPSANVSESAITVENVAYAEGKYPSDLMLGYPRTTDEKCPHGNTVATNGICATEGEIRMNFQYVMSQVIVNLQTSDGTDKVVFDDNTKVEIIGGYTDGTILLGNGSATMGTKADYTMNRKGASNVAYHDAIIPQDVTVLKFRITVTDPDSHTQDTYETVFAISDIKVTEGGDEKSISAWEPGKKYIYNLYITKTGIKVTATIKDWITATGGTNIWM